MAEQQQPVAISAAFPAPPPFYKNFTTENLARLQEIRSSHESAIEPIPPEAPVKSPPPLDITSLPPELRYLIPPPPPTGHYRSFGTDHDATPLPLPADPSALPDTSRLRTLIHRILLEFLSLTHILATDPAAPVWGKKWEELRDVFLEAHGAINEYRPHQARESLIELMEEQVRKGREEIRLCAEAGSKVREVLKGLGRLEGGVDGNEDGNGLVKAKRKREDEKTSMDRRIWQCLEREVGSA